MQIIERKFLVNKLPNISNITPIHYERHILPTKSGVEKRIQCINDRCELEEVEVIETGSALKRNIVKKVISREEFETLRGYAIGNINRDSYLISENPNFTVKIYGDNYMGLIRAEIKFESEEEAKNFKLLEWLGEEITASPLGRDSELVKLSQEEFKNLLSSLSEGN